MLKLLACVFTVLSAQDAQALPPADGPTGGPAGGLAPLVTNVVSYHDSDAYNVDKLGPGDTGYADSNSYPWRSIGGISYGARAHFICTATLVGPRLALTNSHCLKDRLRFHAKDFFLSFNPKGERFPAAGKRVRAKPWSGGAPTIITGKGKERKAYFSGTDWYLLVLDEPIGFEKGWIGVINANGDIIQGHTGRTRRIGDINRRGTDACKVNRNPLASLKNKTPPSNPPWWSVKQTQGLDSICLAGFPDKYFVAGKMTAGGNHDLIVSSNCFLRGRADDLIAHNCAASEGGSGSAMFAVIPKFGPLIIAVHTGGFGVSMPREPRGPRGEFFLRPGGYGYGHYNLAVSADRFFDAIVRARTDIEGKPPKLLRLGDDQGRQ